MKNYQIPRWILMYIIYSVIGLGFFVGYQISEFKALTLYPVSALLFYMCYRAVFLSN